MANLFLKRVARDSKKNTQRVFDDAKKKLSLLRNKSQLEYLKFFIFGLELQKEIFLVVTLKKEFHSVKISLRKKKLLDDDDKTEVKRKRV